MWEKLDLVRIYTKPKGKQPDYSSPVVLRHSRCSVEDFCNNIHKDIAYAYFLQVCFPNRDSSNTCRQKTTEVSERSAQASG